MKDLRRIIRDIIVESVGHPKMDELVQRFLDDPRGLLIDIGDRKIRNGYHIKLIDPTESSEFDLDIIGKISIAQIQPPKAPCYGAYSITGYSKMNQRYNLGPLLYDIGIELAGKKGLMADRTDVSDAALQVWDKYLLMRDDVKRKQLDDFRIGWTDNKEDDCRLGNSYWRFVGLHGNPKYTDLPMDPLNVLYKDWIQGEKTSPLSKVYYKEGTPVMDRLKDRIVRNRASVTDVILGDI